MIQRIQTVYLAATSLLGLAMLFLPLANYNTPETEFVFRSHAIVHVTGEPFAATWPVLILIVLSVILSLVNIFFYRNRRLQLKVGGGLVLLQTILIAALIFYGEDAKESIGGVTDTTYKIPWFIPIINIFLLVLANRGIRKDHALVRAADRIR